MQTGEMKSRSINAGLYINQDNQEYRLVYTYVSIPKQTIQKQSPIHYGTVIFDLNDNFNVVNVSGNYWTSRNTGGVITLKRKV